MWFRKWLPLALCKERSHSGKNTNYMRTSCQVCLIARSFLFVRFSFETSAGRKMASGEVSMLIFILASGYLFAVYILLAIAKHNRKKSGGLIHQVNESTSQSDVSVAQKVGEAISNPESILNS